MQNYKIFNQLTDSKKKITIIELGQIDVLSGLMCFMSFTILLFL